MKKIVPICDLKIGMFVSAITKAKGNLVVKSQGMIKSQATIESLGNRGIVELEIDLAKSEYHEDLPQTSNNSELPSDTSSPQKIISFDQQQRDLAAADRLYSEAREIHERFIKKLKNGQAPDFAALQSLSQNIIDSVFDNADALACLIMLKESNDYLIEHSLNCSILMSIFAKHMGFNQAEIEDVTLAGLLMDCGMALLPPELLGRTDNFSSTDITLMQTHVDIGVELAERYSDLPLVVVDIMANHHERINALGYPKHKGAEEISQYAKMAAIADVYDAMLTERPFRSSTSARDTLEKMQKNDGLDIALVNQFIDAIGLFPVGSIVHLKSEKLAIVVQRNRKDPLKPMVMAFYSMRAKHHTDIKRIDLSKQQTDKIIGSVTPEEFGIHLPSFFRKALFSL